MLIYYIYRIKLKYILPNHSKLIFKKMALYIIRCRSRVVIFFETYQNVDRFNFHVINFDLKSSIN